MNDTSLRVRALGLDVGEKTVGVALSDELLIAAHPVATLVRAGNRADAERIRALIEEHGVADVVVGWPLTLSGAEGRAARRVRALLDRLAPLLPAGVQIHQWDERFSTVQAERVLVEADLSRKRRKQVVDTQAAIVILQSWLDRAKPG